ncbi:hypothetical protein SAMN00120144_4319 [Hymenobacter roseosalivarius DSM 11622]|jgi:hypothetical protein|uniref:Uncharacterized protein n=1 Tax=Hymenobacter roseosalivarius DSM 11622 TaxID=645990 RepID=A0A1W1W4T4_9BACT|nr:hypothetical protein SAMN00120144_4319 [Hymenobacter roseosalivarius DSM 11622]
MSTNKRFRGLSSYFAVDREWEQHYRKGRKTPSVSGEDTPACWHSTNEGPQLRLDC